jgi:hypothetical protein
MTVLLKYSVYKVFGWRILARTTWSNLLLFSYLTRFLQATLCPLFKSQVQARISHPFRTGMHNYPTLTITIIRHNTICMTLPTNAKCEGRIQVSYTNIHHLTKAQFNILLYSFETAGPPRCKIVYFHQNLLLLFIYFNFEPVFNIKLKNYLPQGELISFSKVANIDVNWKLYFNCVQILNCLITHKAEPSRSIPLKNGLRFLTRWL